MITTQEAKELTLEVWRYLRDHPEIGRKKDLPEEIYDKIKYFSNACPLCRLFFKKDCYGCPLRSCDYWISAYGRWCHGNSETRKQAAAKIVEMAEAWEPEARNAV